MRKASGNDRAVASGAIATILLVEPPSANSAQASACYLPEYTASGDLVLPKNFHEWVYVGSPLTPNALNGGKAGFPEFHNVYIEPCSYEKYKKTNVFPEGTIFFKELQLTLPAENPGRLADRAFGERLFPRALQRRRCDRQGYQALCRYRWMGLLQFQSS